MRRALKWIGIAAGGLLFLLAFLLWLADTSIGHRFIADQIAAQSPKSGLRIRVGRIEGSIYSDTRLRDVRVYDPKGLFLNASEVRLNWTPLKWLANRLDISTLEIPVATLHKLPKLNPSQTKQPILPGFDIRIGSLTVERLVIAPGLAGRDARIGTIKGKADIRKGRALIDLTATAEGGDRLALMLDAEPDGNKFDLATDLNAPAGGVFGQMIGTNRAVAVKIEGDGDWNKWQGSLLGDVSGAQVAKLALTNTDGTFALNGQLALASITQGKVQRLTGPILRVRGDAKLANRRVETHLRLASEALITLFDGTLDLANNRFAPMLVNARLLKPKELFPNMSGRDLELKVRLDGTFARPGFDYLLTTPFVAFDQTGFEGVRASGQGRVTAEPILVPIRLTAKRVTGVGDVAGGILQNLSVEGPLRVTTKVLTGDGLILKSDKLKGRISLFLDFATGRYDVGLAGQLGRYLIPGLGIVDVKSELHVVPGPGGAARRSRVAGRPGSVGSTTVSSQA